MSDRPVFYEEGSSSISIAMPSPNSNVNGGDDDHLLQRSGPSTAAVEREHMFDKVVTPSDVGKLNRLVIPKQHAEKYFPLDSSTNEKGLVLNFEDRNGKPWRFRYSYWNSSQSYVMTKGWSRFVKEKKLDAGDIVSFQRGLDADKDRLFIDWRRRPDPLPNHFSTSFQYSSTTNPWNHLFLNANAPPPPPPPEYAPYYNHLAQHQHQHHQNQNQNQYGINYGYDTSVVNGNPCPPGSIFYLSRPGNGTGSGAGGGSGFIVEEGVVQSEQMPVPVVQGKAAAKRLRLFGVNMDCPIQQESMLSDSNTAPLHQYFPASPTTTSSSSFPDSPHLMRPNYSDNNDDEDDKGKGSMSLDLGI